MGKERRNGKAREKTGGRVARGGDGALRSEAITSWNQRFSALQTVARRAGDTIGTVEVLRDIEYAREGLLVRLAEHPEKEKKKV